MPGVVAVTSWTWFGGVFEEEKGVTFPNFAVEPDDDRARSGPTTRSHPQALDDVRAPPRRRDRRRRHAREVRLEGRRQRHAEEHRLPGRPHLPDRRRDPERARAALLVPARVPGAGGARRRAARFDFARHDLGARRRSGARRPAHARDRRDVPQQRGARPPARPRRATSRTSSARSRGFVSLIILIVTGAGRGVHRVHRREHREHGRARAACARSRS